MFCVAPECRLRETRCPGQEGSEPPRRNVEHAAEGEQLAPEPEQQFGRGQWFDQFGGDVARIAEAGAGFARRRTIDEQHVPAFARQRAGDRAADDARADDRDRFLLRHTATVYDLRPPGNRPAMQRIRVIDSHTAGEPTRLVIDGGPDLGSGPLEARVQRFRDEFDAWRSAVVNEPRGSDTMVGALLCAPHRADCSFGVIFFNNVGFLGMCGHGTIGLVASLAHAGRLAPGALRIDTPVGAVDCAVARRRPHRRRQRA